MGKLTLLGFFREQLSPVGPVTTVDLTGKTVMLIGANVGLGFEACKHFARMNPGRLIMACRNKAKGEAAIVALRNDTGYERAELAIVDLADFVSVTSFCDDFLKDGKRLDVLVESAGANTREYKTTPDGWEATLQINCLSTFLIAFRLLPLMIETGKAHATLPRLVLVTSGAHYWCALPNQKELINAEEIYKTMSSKDWCTPEVMSSRYSDSKLLEVLFYRALNDRLGPHSPVIVTGVNPGMCYSAERSEPAKTLVSWLMRKFVARTYDQGGRQLVYAAVAGEGDEDKFRGGYVSSLQLFEASDFGVGKEGDVTRDKLWKEVLDILVKVDHRVKEGTFLGST